MPCILLLTCQMILLTFTVTVIMPRFKVSLEAFSNRIVRLSIIPSHLHMKCNTMYLKFGWYYSNRTGTVSSYKGCSHFTDITCPWGLGRGKKCRTCRFILCCCRGHLVVLHEKHGQQVGITLSGIWLSVRLSFCVCLSHSHTFLVVTYCYDVQAIHAFLGMLPFWF